MARGWRVKRWHMAWAKVNPNLPCIDCLKTEGSFTSNRATLFSSLLPAPLSRLRLDCLAGKIAVYFM